MTHYEHSLAWAEAQDAADPLRDFRTEFLIPPHEGRDSLYFCGNSLGLQPRSVRAAIDSELDYWGELAVEGHFRGRLPWLDYHEYVRDDLATVVGALPLRSGGDEHPGREPAPDDGQLLSAHRRSATPS